jgi:hypothetical protein
MRSTERHSKLPANPNDAIYSAKVITSGEVSRTTVEVLLLLSSLVLLSKSSLGPSRPRVQCLTSDRTKTDVRLTVAFAAADNTPWIVVDDWKILRPAWLEGVVEVLAVSSWLLPGIFWVAEEHAQ